MTQTTAPPRRDASPSPGPDDRRSWRWLVLRRLLVVGGAALLTVSLLVLGVATIALNVDWRVPDRGALSGPTVVYAADGSELVRFTSEVDRRVVGLADVSQVARDAIVASEDARFYEHRGVDPVSLLRAIVVNVRTGGVSQGGSTLTQQYVKNAFVGSERTFQRKVREAVISIALERQLSKDEILERYLNQVYFGEGAYGIEAAALTYFGVSASELDAAQGATLAQLLPAPSLRNPRVDPDGAVLRRDALLDRMVALGALGADEAASARTTPLEVLPRERATPRYPFFVAHVRQLLEARFGTEAVLTGALQVTTTLQPDAQEALRAAVAERLPRQEDRPEVDAGAIAVDPATGRILAMYGGREYAPGEQEFNLATQARRRPGSTFKPLAFLAALEQDIPFDEVYPAPARFREGELCDPGWGPANAGGRGYGRLPLHAALSNSVNTVFAQVGCDVGAEALAGLAARLGGTSPLGDSPQLAIGGVDSNSTVLDLASIYATIANDGLRCPVHAIAEVRDQDGEVLAERLSDRPLTEDVLDGRPEAWADDDTDACARLLEADHVRHTTQALQRVVAETTGTRADIGRPQAGKTGTTDDEVDAWFAGYTPDLALVVRVGDREEVPLTDIAGFPRVQGGTIPALIWHDAAAAILADVEPTAFPLPGDEDDDGVVGPARRRPAPPAPSPSPAPSPTPSDAPSDDPSPSPEPSPSPTTTSPLDPGGGGPGGGSEDPGGGCLPLIQDCDDEPPGDDA